MTLISSLRVHLILALVLAAFVLPGIVRESTICYPDGCVVTNVEATKDQLAAFFGNQATLAQSLETTFQWAIYNGHALINAVRDAAGRIVFLACANSVTNTAIYNNTNNTTNTNNTSCPLGYTQHGNQCIFNTCPQGYAFQDGQCVYRNRCTTPPHCNGNDLMNSCTGAKLQACDWGCSGGLCNPTPAPSATLKAIPSLVHSGDITIVSWTGTNVSSCIVHNTNGDSWTGKSSTGKTSSPILGQTIYTLHCVGYQYSYPPSVDMSVTVNLIPTFNEQ